MIHNWIFFFPFHSLKLISYSWFLGVINPFAPRERRRQETTPKRGERKGKEQIFPNATQSLITLWRIDRSCPCAQLCNFLLWEHFVTVAHKLPRPDGLLQAVPTKGWPSLLGLIIKYPAFSQRVRQELRVPESSLAVENSMAPRHCSHSADRQFPLEKVAAASLSNVGGPTCAPPPPP